MSTSSFLNFFKRLVILGFFFFIFVFSIVQLVDWIFLMSGFELRISDVGNNSYSNWATITALAVFSTYSCLILDKFSYMMWLRGYWNLAANFSHVATQESSAESRLSPRKPEFPETWIYVVNTTQLRLDYGSIVIALSHRTSLLK